MEIRKDYDYDDVVDWLQNQDEYKLRKVSYGCWDTQPDEFYFSFLGISGKFAFDWDGLPQVVSNVEVKILNWYRNGKGEIDYWSLQGPDGTVYYFQDLERRIVHNGHNVENPCSFGPRDHITSWKLTKIESPTSGIDLNFEYEDFILDLPYTYSESRTIKDPYTHSSCKFPTSVHTMKTRVSTATKRLSSIERSDGLEKMEFLYEEERSDVNIWFDDSQPLFALTGIVKKYNNIPVENIKFDQFYQNKLMLRSIEFAGTSLEEGPKYVFDYNSISLPEYNSKSVDHWGYFNGKGNGTLLPSHVYSLSPNGPYILFEGADRWADDDYSKASVLTSIENPTGSVVNFEWEGNNYSKVRTIPVSERIYREPRFETFNMNVESDPNSEDWQYDYSEEFTIEDNNDGGDFVEVNIHGITHATFVGFAFTPKLKIFNALTDEEVITRSLATVDGAECDNPDEQFLGNESIFLPEGDYYGRVQARDYPYCGNSNDLIIATIKPGFFEILDMDEVPGPGLRVKRKTTVADETYIIDYSYKNPSTNLSSGIIQFEPNYFLDGADIQILNFPVGRQICDFIQIVGQYSQPHGGDLIQYTAVEEYHQDGLLGKVRVQNASSLDIISETKPFAPPSKFDYKRGYSLITSIFKNGNDEDLRQESHNTPVTFSKSIASPKISIGRIAWPLSAPPKTEEYAASIYQSQLFEDKFAFTYNMPLNLGIHQIEETSITEIFEDGSSFTKTNSKKYNTELNRLMEQKTGSGNAE